MKSIKVSNLSMEVLAYLTIVPDEIPCQELYCYRLANTMVNRGLLSFGQAEMFSH